MPPNGRDVQQVVVEIIRKHRVEVRHEILTTALGTLVVSLEPLDGAKIDWSVIRCVAGEIEKIPGVTSVVLSVGRLD